MSEKIPDINNEQLIVKLNILQLKVAEYEKEKAEYDSQIKKEKSLRNIAENELTRIETALNSTSDAIGISTPDGAHFFQNNAFIELFGFDSP